MKFVFGAEERKGIIFMFIGLWKNGHILIIIKAMIMVEYGFCLT